MNYFLITLALIIAFRSEGSTIGVFEQPLYPQYFIDDLKNFHQNRKIFFYKGKKIFKASIIATRPDAPDEDIRLLRRARETVFDSFRKSTPRYTEAQWDHILALDPLFDPASFVLVIQDYSSGEIVGNLKMVYSHPSRPLPAEKRFPGAYSPPNLKAGPVNMFNLVDGRTHHYGQKMVGGAVQIMELYGQQMSSALMFLANIVLIEHPFVYSKLGKFNFASYPAEVIGYGDKNEIESYHSRAGMKVIANDNGYILSRMSTNSFKDVYRSSFIFRPGSKILNRDLGFMYQVGGYPNDEYLYIDDIFSDFSRKAAENNRAIAKRFTMKLIAYGAKAFNSKDQKLEISHMTDLFQWMLGSKNECLRFYKK